MNLLKLMKNAGKIQEMIQQQKQNIENAIVIGESGAGLVTLKMNGKYQGLELVVDDSLMNDKAMLIELILAAFNNATEKVGSLMQEKLMDTSKMFGGDLGGILGGEDGKE